MSSVKIDKILDWLSVVSGGKNYHLQHKRFVGLPNRRSPSVHLAWLNEVIAKVEEESGEVCPYSSINFHDVRRWKDRYPELFISDLAQDINLELRESSGIDAVTAAGFAVYVSAKTLRRLELRLEQLDNNSPELNGYLKLVDKFSCRLAACTETFNRIKMSESSHDGLIYAYEMAANAIALSKADPSASPQMRQWLEHLLMASLAKLEPVRA